MSTGLPAAPNGGMNLRNAASRSGGIAISESLLSTQASDRRTPEAAGARDDDHVLALGRGQDGDPARELQQVAQRSRADDTGLLQARLRRSCRCGERTRVRTGGARAQARAASLQHHDRFLLRHPLRDLGERPAILQVLAVLAMICVLSSCSKNVSRSSSSISDLLPRPTIAETPFSPSAKNR